MEDVILYNESWNIDKLSPYNTFYMEGSIIDGLKRLWQAFLNMLKRIKQRLQYMFNSDARIYRKVVQGLKIPSVVADWKETRCPKRDYSVLKELLAKGIELCDCILSIKDVFENVEVVDGHATWTPSEISKWGNNNKDIIKINGELKTITTKKQQAPVENGQTVYDLATEWVEIYELTVRYLMRHDKVIEFTKEMDKIVKSLPENQATVTSKLMQNWITGLSYLHNVEGPAGPMINARVDSRDGFVQIKTMLDENSKLLEKALKTTREASAEAEEAIKDSENFMRNNKNLLKKYAPWKEYYTEGMTDMNTIIYKDDQPENDGEITTESANEEPTIDEVNAYIEYAMNDLHDAMELRNRLIQESDDDTVEDFEESDDDFSDEYEEDGHPDTRNSTINQYDTANRDANITKYCLKRKLPNTDYSDMEELHDQSVKTKKKIQRRLLHTNAANAETNKKYKYSESYEDTIIHNYNEPIQENKTYCLKTNDMFTTESYDEPTGPDRFVQEYNPDTKAAVLGGILGYSAHTTLLIAGITTNVMGIVKAVESIIASATYKKKYGRFAEDMKAVMDILKESKDGTIKTGLLNKALHTLRDDCDTISGKGIISHKAMVNLTATERSEIKQLSTIIKDLERMLTSKPNKAAERRIPARIEDFVKKCETVTKLLNRGKNPGDVVKEYMS